MKKIAGFLITLFIVLTAGAATAFAASPARVQVLMIGDRDEWVTELQQALYDLGYYTGLIDGLYDDDVTAAVKAFQKANGLDADGKAGSATQKKIYSGSAVAAAPGHSDK